ncbi:MAG: 4Fe-4S binding protein [Chloroflexi bacterium]|nr:4Fe-4S binding protein [Chloroflexota bacterium]
MGDRNRLYSLLPRRAFIEWVSKGAIVFVLAGVIRFIGPKDRLVAPEGGVSRDRIIRPPGAVPEEEFLSLCIRCDKCITICPYNIITPVLITESVVSVGTPRLTGFFCATCRRCIPVCPTGALRRERS